MVSLTVALGFTLHGAWTILFFSVIELLAVGAAMLVYARHATDCEVVALESGGAVRACGAVHEPVATTRLRAGAGT
ncbi:DUF2244 domain-containing protein [Herbaspirillum rubrisubalbicans]|uniref:DUF2244 domain-containing protein n=1 Tax=Herbaspirillum rubrisubalbicans TaxID=80842 RepID=UPI003AAFF3B8